MCGKLRGGSGGGMAALYAATRTRISTTTRAMSMFWGLVLPSAALSMTLFTDAATHASVYICASCTGLSIPQISEVRMDMHMHAL
jgi:hypothetical protein